MLLKNLMNIITRLSNFANDNKVATCYFNLNL